MSKRRRFLDYLATSNGKTSLLIVVVCGLVLAFFVGRTYLDPAKVYSLDFGQAEWIEAAKPSPNNYFRKDIYLSGSVEQAWIQIAATDRYLLYVNGHLVDDRSFFGMNPSGLYDLKKALKPGKNALAIAVNRKSYPGSAQVIVRGFYALQGSPKQEFYSDSTWRASNTQDGIVGSYAWNATALEDSFWAFAKKGSTEGRFPVIEWVSFDPRLIESKPTAKWIGPARGGAFEASFSCNFKVPADRKETWLQIAATGDYDVSINGALVASQPFATQPKNAPVPADSFATELRTDGIVTQPLLKPRVLSPRIENSIENAPPPQPFSTQPLLLAFEVSRWLHTGENTLLIRVRSQTQAAMLLLEGDTVRADGILQAFETDSSWNAFSSTAKKEPAVVLGEYGAAPWGQLEQKLASPSVTPAYDLQMFGRWGLVIVIVEAVFLVAWMLIASLAGALLKYSAESLWTFDAVSHLCVLALMLACWLLTFDVRFPSNWCFTPQLILGFVALLLVGKLLLFLPRRAKRLSAATAEPPRSAWWLRRYGGLVVLIGIVLLGFGLRLHELPVLSLDVDEMGIIEMSHGVQQRGYPFVIVGPFDREVTTYEAVSYPVAAARQFLGESEIAYRTPALIWGTLTIVIIGIAGYRMMGWGVGLVAALVYATFPAGIWWGHNAFWPSQEQFFALISVWCFYEAASRPGPLRHGFLTAASIAFSLAYLSWEGAGFLLPVLFGCMFVLRWGKYDWMKDWHLWRCCVFMSFVVLIQLTHRQVAATAPYLQTGNSLAEVTTPTLVPLDLTKFAPFFYFYWLLFAENYVVMTLVALLGIAFCWRDRPIRYLFVLTAGMIACYTEFLPAYAVRYSYGYQAMLILLSVGVMFKLLGAIIGLRGSWLRWCGAAALLTLFILSTNGFVLKTYRLASNPTKPFYGERMGLYRDDSRSPARFLAEHVRPGDGLVIAIPNLFEHYSHLVGDYSINTMFDNRITYDGALDSPYFIDKYRGYPTIRGIEELQDVRARYKRLWVLRGGGGHTNPAVEQYFALNAKEVFESYGVKVDLIGGERDVGP
jgi:uncharacterized protein YjeT (DUF2065 family)